MFLAHEKLYQAKIDLFGKKLKRKKKRKVFWISLKIRFFFNRQKL